MARIHALPSLEIIRGLKGILDFYMWKGLPCVRAWPTYRPARQTAASLAAALVFGAIVKSYNLLGDAPLEAYRDDALDQTRTARDIMVTGAYGNLHEASMSDFLNLLTECRDFLSNLQALLTALDSIDTDELVVNVDQSVLPPLAATTTNQATQIAALQKLDDLQDALQSKALDRLIVRSEDQLFSYGGTLVTRNTDVLDANDGYVYSPSPPAGQLWVVTNTLVHDSTRATTSHAHELWTGAAGGRFHRQTQAFPKEEDSGWHGLIVLPPGYSVRFRIYGGQAADSCWYYLTGYRMTLET